MKTIKRTKMFMLLAASAAFALPAAADAGQAEGVPMNNDPQIIRVAPVGEPLPFEAPEGAQLPASGAPENFVIGEMLVKFRDRVTPDDPGMSALKKKFGAALVHTHTPINVHLFRLQAVKTKEDTLAAIEKFKNHPLVEFAEPNGGVEALPRGETTTMPRIIEGPAIDGK